MYRNSELKIFVIFFKAYDYKDLYINKLDTKKINFPPKVVYPTIFNFDLFEKKVSNFNFI